MTASARVSRVLPDLAEAEVKEKMRSARNFRQQQKWWIVDNALVAARTPAEIAKHTGTNVPDVHQVVNEYNRQGVTAIETPGSLLTTHSVSSALQKKPVF